jgi:hypothetical protein
MFIKKNEEILSKLLIIMALTTKGAEYRGVYAGSCTYSYVPVKAELN